jgi:hypothetical protein
MNRRNALKAMTAMSAAVAALWEIPAHAAPSDALYAKCAQACLDSMKACQACNKHCAEMLHHGMKEHEKSRRLSEDCQEICALCAKLCKRKGPITAAMVEACRKACDLCGAECRKYPTMKPMADCAKSCAACSKICRELLAAMK